MHAAASAARASFAAASASEASDWAPVTAACCCLSFARLCCRAALVWGWIDVVVVVLADVCAEVCRLLPLVEVVLARGHRRGLGVLVGGELGPAPWPAWPRPR